MKATTTTLRAVTHEDYRCAFEAEANIIYDKVDEFVERCGGYTLDWQKLLAAARVLACPVKIHAPNWQHGRVIYARVRQYVHEHPTPRVNAIDIGTAKGFSALCLLWALMDAPEAECSEWIVTSLDVIDPHERVRRNTIAEVDGYKTLAEILAPWPETRSIAFVRSTGQHWLTSHADRIHVAFVDGKHTYDAVSWEAALLAERQHTGDIVMFDDVQIAGVAKALTQVRAYEFEYLEVTPHRRYAIGTRR